MRDKGENLCGTTLVAAPTRDHSKTDIGVTRPGLLNCSAGPLRGDTNVAPPSAFHQNGGSLCGGKNIACPLHSVLL